ncbi:MAG TPA: tetratricopeptide repeat protein, partial [Anaerolineae bacterium]|nr:tetratricopeptide repeat protein [Anaerolineae bacterium]
TTRFVTLTGTGGVGKTRLAMELAHQMRKSFPDGVWCLELAGNDDPDLVPSMLLSRLRTPAVSNGGDRSVTNALTRHLCHRHALIVLDNCEHLIAACAQLVESLVTSCQDLHIVTTSREPLRVSGETCYFVPSLETPPAGDVELPAFAVAELDSVRLFVERAKSRMPGFGLTAENARHVGNLCRRLDGIPLAIELAAGRVSSLTPESLVEHLDQRFALLTGGSPTALPRHRTLRAMIDWSYDLLLDAERVLLGRLSVFAGDWTLEAVQHIAAFGPLRAEQVLGLLPGLVEKSLVMLDPATSRYHLLETVRAYGLERLRNGGEEADCRARHVGYYLHFVESCDFVSSEDFATAARLFKEQDEFLAAISWCEHMQSGAQLALRFLEATGLYWMILGQSDVGYRLARRALAIPGAEIRTRARGRALLTLANMGYFQGRGPEVRTAAKESVSIAREVGDERGEATALNCLARILDQLGEHEKALELFGDALRLARRLHLNAEASKIENDMADTLRCMGDFESARALYKQSLETASRAQRTTFAVVVRCINLSTVAIQLRDVPAARKWLRQGVDAASESTVPFPWWFVLNAAVGLASATEEWSVAAHFYGAAEADRERHGGDAVDPADARFLEPLIARAREQLGEIAYKHSYEAGCALPNAGAVGELRTWLESTETRVA